MEKHIFLSILFLLGLLLASCKPVPSLAIEPIQIQDTPEISLIDGLNRIVVLNEPAQRIVSLAPSNTEILYAIGAGSQIVGRDDFSDYPVEAKDLPSVGSSFGNYNLEAITQLKPNLVLAAEINTPEQVQAIENLGITVFYLANPMDMEGLFVNINTVATMAGRSAEGNMLVDSLRNRVQGITNALALVIAKPLVYYELDATDPSKPWTPGPGTFLTKLITMAGGTSIGESLTSDYAQINLEYLLVQDPAIILLGDAAYGTTAESVAQRIGWGSLSAVQNQAIYPFDDNLVSRPGPRLVDGLEQLAGMIHPEIFAK
jgi:iron complex transport system substrate-binding protein